jgi:hypothetical protein
MEASAVELLIFVPYSKGDDLRGEGEYHGSQHMYLERGPSQW